MGDGPIFLKTSARRSLMTTYRMNADPSRWTVPLNSSLTDFFEHNFLGWNYRKNISPPPVSESSNICI
jgi:hypothetical protein